MEAHDDEEAVDDGGGEAAAAAAACQTLAPVEIGTELMRTIVEDQQSVECGVWSVCIHINSHTQAQTHVTTSSTPCSTVPSSPHSSPTHVGYIDMYVPGYYRT